MIVSFGNGVCRTAMTGVCKLWHARHQGGKRMQQLCTQAAS